MRCVLDVNVLVAALLSRRGTPAELLRLWLDGTFDLVVSPRLMHELARVLAYPKIRTKIDQNDAVEFLELLSRTATVIADPPRPPSVPTADPEDDYIVALAEAARAIIVSGDKHLLDLAGELPVYRPGDFRAMLT